MDQRLIEIEDDGLLVLIPLGPWQVDFHVFDLPLIRDLCVVEHPQVLDGREQMLPREGLLLSVGSEDLRNVVGRVSGRIWIVGECVQVLVLGDLGDELFQWRFRAAAG